MNAKTGWEPDSDEIRNFIADLKLPGAEVQLRGAFGMSPEVRPSILISLGEFHREVPVPYEIEIEQLARIVVRAYAMTCYERATALARYKGMPL